MLFARRYLVDAIVGCIVLCGTIAIFSFQNLFLSDIFPTELAAPNRTSMTSLARRVGVTTTMVSFRLTTMSQEGSPSILQRGRSRASFGDEVERVWGVGFLIYGCL